MGKVYLHWLAPLVPSALFGAGVPDKNLSWATTVGNQLHRVAMDYEQTLGKGHKMVPNLALEEQTGALPWEAVVAAANASLSNKLKQAKGPDTWPRQFAKARLAAGKDLGLTLPNFPQRTNKLGSKLRARKMAKREAMMSRRKLREACSSAVGPSNRKLYCSLAKGQFPKVCGQASQSFLERQVVGLAPYPPQTGPTRACQCGAQLGTEHIVFECPDLVVPRQMLLASLDMIAATYASETEWAQLTDRHKLETAFCPSRKIFLLAAQARPFYHKSVAVWQKFYEDAEDTLAP